MLPGSEPDLARAAERVVLVIAQVLAQVSLKGRLDCRVGRTREQPVWGRRPGRRPQYGASRRTRQRGGGGQSEPTWARSSGSSRALPGRHTSPHRISRTVSDVSSVLRSRVA